MNTRIMPCSVCQKTLTVSQITATVENAPDLLSGADLWFGVMRDSVTEKIGILVCCSAECAETLGRSTLLRPQPAGSA